VLRLKKLFILCLLTFAVSALASVNFVHAATVVISNEDEANDRGFREPLDTSSRNVSGSDAVGDREGGTSALVLKLIAPTETTQAKEKATVEYTLGSAVNTLDDVIALGVMSFDIYSDVLLSASLGGAAFKLKCGNTSKSVEITKGSGAPNIYPPSGEWTRLSFDLATTEFSDKTLAGWKADGSWCSQDGRIPDRVQAFQVGIGSANQAPPSDYNVYLDYFQFGTNQDIYNFEMSNGTDLIDVPDAPTNLSAEAGDGFAVITFEQPDGSDNGAPITNYSWSSDGTTFTPLDPEDASTSITISPLTNNQNYSITLKALNSEGASEASDPAVSVTPLASEILPAAPVITSVESGYEQFKINFTQPSVTGEGAVIDYRLYVEGIGEYPTGQTQSPITVTVSQNGATYEVSIAAENDDGVGPDSNQVTVTVPPDTDGDGVQDPNDPCPNDPTCTSLAVPVLPWPALLTLLALVGWLGCRRLSFF
jgi:hypothetical protein